jgi:diguanylate cyclase (GGDEF)-like protein
MVNSADFVVFFLIACGLVAGGYLLAWPRLALERRRAKESERRAESLLALVEARSRESGEPVSTRRLGESPSGVAAAASPAPLASATPSETRYLFVSFDEEIRRAGERGVPLTLVILSLGYGDSGDEAAHSDRLLRAVAHAVRRQMRGCDTCVRYATDQFILILPDVSRDGARRVETRLRMAVQGVVHEPRPGISLRARPSLGSATFPAEGSSFDPLLTLAESRRLQDRSVPEELLERPEPTARFRVPAPALSRN